MKINWKERFKNKTFVIAFGVFIISTVYTAMSLFGIVPTISEDTATNYVLLIVELLGALGIIVDPTTGGMNDSERALTYGTENDVRNTEIVG